ncbi:MAG: transketolase [Muribaculaceae bacterium]|nr:transketolase [Muribaculaceae bacterium]
MAKEIRRSCLDMAHRVGKTGSHIGPGLSAVEIFAVLFGKILNLNPADAENPERDRLVVSKGHCVLSYYSALRLAGFITEADLESFETDGSDFHGHAVRNIGRGIEFSGGSLSMGMSFAVGQALACKKKGPRSRVFCIVGDGECDEGLIWEAAMAATNFKLSNLTVIVDCNQLQYDGFTTEVMDTAPLSDKFRAFGFEVVEVDGHSCEQLAAALAGQTQQKPRCIIAHTIKGKGVSFMELKKEWHHHTLSDNEYAQAINDIE